MFNLQHPDMSPLYDAHVQCVKVHLIRSSGYSSKTTCLFQIDKWRPHKLESVILLVRSSMATLFRKTALNIQL